MSDLDDLDNRFIYDEGGEQMEEEKVDYAPLYQFFIAGVQHHRIKEVINFLKEGDFLMLVPEPSNKFDPNAVRIEIMKDDEAIMLGYVPKKISAEVSASITIGKNLECVLTDYNKQAKPWEMAKVEIREVF